MASLVRADGIPFREKSMGGGGNLSVVTMRSIYYANAVAAALEKLPHQEHESLRATYERMLEKWPERFQVKPSGLPAMQHLYDELPNFWEPLDDIRRQLALANGSKDPIEITPMLLLGPPWVGKTHFAREVAKLLWTGMGFISMSSLTAGWVLSGASSQWKWARPGKVFETLVDGYYANPVMVVDEIDKARGEHAYDPLGALYSLLEHDTAQEFTDEFADVAVDASQIIWVATANDERCIPEPILNRMNVYNVLAPTPDQARDIGRRLYVNIRWLHDWGKQFNEQPSEEALELLSTIWPREMKKVLMTAFGNARLDWRYTLKKSDFPEASWKKVPLGFVNEFLHLSI